ncbi:cysteine desulfurase family protein [Propionivibrio sp.]|uniref:cysteine desulfurase family protein n=1 Tax=Propionivibrio sp. TaxID=2212460 RepID=UPI00261BA91E|nr:cysteine desulfurase family protein [Propionivibrio sp.]
MFAPVYFDHNATTPLEPPVLQAMLPWLSEQFGNASSRHEYGRAARRAIDEARSQVASAVGAHPTEIVFTSGGSEANNLFIKGAAACLKPGLLAVSAVEHPCVIKPAEQLVRRGWRLHKLALDADGRIDEQGFQVVLAQQPKLVSVMLANNETGVLQDVAALAAQAKAAGAWFHTDAVQAVGKIAVDFRRLNAAGVHALTLSAHKIGGPKGAAALVLDKRVELEPLIAGGGHERGLRSGTENVAALVGFGMACELAERRLAAAPVLIRLRAQLESGLRDMGATLFGTGAERLPNTVCFALPGVDGETLVAQLDRAGFALASGAACSSANPEPSHVLRAMGVAPELARGAVRISLGHANTAAQVNDFFSALRNTAAKLQRLTAVAI